MPNNYQDYVIKDGVYVGDFERMYQDCDDPWHMSSPDTLELWLRSTTVHMLSMRTGSVIEVGSGFGHLTNMLADRGITVWGIEISATAARKARSLYPDIPFVCGSMLDVLAECLSTEVVLLADVLWYILPDLDELWAMLVQIGVRYLAVKQRFFTTPGIQQYGRNYFTNLNEFICFCPFPLLESHQRIENGTEGTASLFSVDA